MTRNKMMIAASLAALAVTLYPGLSTVNAKQAAVTERTILVFKQGVSQEEKNAVLAKLSGSRMKDLELINGAAVDLTPAEKAELSGQPEIARIDEDPVVTIEKDQTGETGVGDSPQLSEIIPWGVDRVDAEKVYPIETAKHVKVAVIDTGIDLHHPDLMDTVKGGYNAIDASQPYQDDHGHGTHVTGIIAAEHDGAGIAGVAPSSELYAVKALNAYGSGTISDLIDALDWSVKKKMDVVNLSIAIGADYPSLHDAIISAYNSGTVIVASAGNSYGGAAGYPAAYPEVISVGATDEGDALAPFSAIGKVDAAAPGTNIYSTYLGGVFTKLSGTSMAAPHVTGVAALVLADAWKGKNGQKFNKTEEVKKILATSSTDLGTPGKDQKFGYGLVNAYRAVVTANLEK